MHIGTLYGDQSIFVLRSVFFELGGFEGLPLMEDVRFSSKLRNYGNVNVSTPKIKSFKRKFSREGTLQRKLKNMWLIILYRIGVSPINWQKCITETKVQALEVDNFLQIV